MYKIYTVYIQYIFYTHAFILSILVHIRDMYIYP